MFLYSHTENAQIDAILILIVIIIFHNGVLRNAVLLIYTMAERIGRVNHRADTLDLTTLV